jgi:transposase
LCFKHNHFPIPFCLTVLAKNELLAPSTFLLVYPPMSHFKSSQIEANILFFYRQRVMVVRLVMEGDLGKEAASTTCVDKLFPILSRCSTKVGWTSHRDFVPGREPFLTKEQQGEIQRLVPTTTPAEREWGVASAWNTKLLQSYGEKHFGVSISLEALRKLRHRRGLSWTRPTYTLGTFSN